MQDMDNVEKSGEETKPLKAKHRLFIEHYINTHNGSEAVRLAGYKAKDPSNTLATLMKRPEIIKAIQEKEAEQLAKIQISKPQFLLKVANEIDKAKQESTRARLLQLYGDVLGFTKKEEATTTTNIFQSIEGAKTFLNGFKDTNTNKPSQDTTEAEIVQPEPTSCDSMGTAQVSGQGKEGGENKQPIANDVSSTLSGDSIVINSDLGGGV